MELSITPEVVKWAYRLFLDREPENEAVVEEKATDCKNILELRRVFLRSEEFKAKNPGFPTLSGHEPPINVDYSVPDRELKRIFKHIQKNWTSLGLNDPYFSVLTQGEFEKESMSNKRINEFYESGKKEVDRLFKTLARNSIDASSFRNCLDFGCGAGRISRLLSGSFETVYAYDVSKNYLKMARKYLESIDISNVDFRRVKNLFRCRMSPF